MRSLRAPRDGRAAAPTRLSRATVNRVSRPPFRRRSVHQTTSPLDHLQNLLVCQTFDGCERMHTRGV